MEKLNSPLLPSPAKKANSAFKCKYPFPIIKSDCSDSQTDPNFNVMVGLLQEHYVLVQDEESMKLLYTQGFFGKGTLSKNAPKICLENEDVECENVQSESQSPKLEDYVLHDDSNDEALPDKISETEEVEEFFGKEALLKNAPKIGFESEDEECEKIQCDSPQSPKLEDDVIDVLDDEESLSAQVLKSEEEFEKLFGEGTLLKYGLKSGLNNEDEECQKLFRIQFESQSPHLEDDVPDDDSDNEAPAKIPITEEVEGVLSSTSNFDHSSTSDSYTSNSASETLQKKKKDSLKENSSDEIESLQLMFVEAYFLSYGLGCLVVKDNRNQPLDLARLWNKFCEVTTEGNFPAMYTAYHHFRSKGWIVKSGLEYGVDYVLYKDDPSSCRATYSVIVKSVKEINLRELKGNRQLTWASLIALNRINRSTSKGLLFLYVIKPTALSKIDTSSPYCISQYTVEEVLFQEWIPAKSRMDSENKNDVE